MMRMNSAIVWVFSAMFVVAAGCVSLGNNGPDATSQGPSVAPSIGNGATINTPTAPQSLTEAQKTQATNIAKADTVVKEILGKPGYSITGVFPDGSGNAVIYIESDNTLHSDGSIWTPDMYQVTVDMKGNKVAGTKHFESKPLPTPTR